MLQMVLIINTTSPLWYWVTRYSPGIAKWLDTTYKTKTDQDLTLNGHIPGQLLFAVNDRDFNGRKYCYIWGPRFLIAMEICVTWPLF
jgi:hypothetical protein